MNISSLDLDLLWVLHVVLEEGSVAGAAKRLHLTPSAVSNALARLRVALGDPPRLVRQGRGVVPTPQARALAPLLARTLGGLEQGLAALQGFDPATTERRFSLALADAEQIAVLGRLARAFAAWMPRGRLEVVSVDTLVARGGLGGSDVDAAIGPEAAEPGLHAAPLYAQEGVFVVRAGHPRVGEVLTAEAFCAERHVDIHLALGRGGRGHRVTEDAIARAGLVRDVAVVVPTFAAAAAVVAETDLVTGLPRRVAAQLAGAFPIRVVDGPGPPLRFPMWLQWHERTAADPGAAAFRALVVEVLGEP
ncbi:MAG: LysR substrate-binding domain-containing protein [Myxococcota bacterium]